MKRAVLSFIVFIITCIIYCQNISIVLNNKPNANIVVLDRTNETLNEIADDLSDYIFKITKARISIINHLNPNKINIIIDTQFEGINYQYELLDEDGFIIKTSGKNIIISGKSDYGTEYGVYDFLERFLGVRWLMPTELWTETPIMNNFILSEIDIEENPMFLTRSFFNVNIQNRDIHLKEWGNKNRLRNRVEFHHNLRHLFKADIIVKNYPHFLPNANDNKKYIPQNNNDHKWNPNFRANGIEVYAADEIIKYFRQNPDKNSYSLGINDTDNFDKSNLDERINHFGLKNYSDAYYSWVNNTVKIVNRTFPNKKFGLLAYSRVAATPSFKLEENVIPFITYERILWLEPKLKHKDIEISEQWQKLTQEYGWYDYVYGYFYLVPRVYFQHYHDYINTAYDMNVRYYVAEYYPNWLEGPKGWIMTKLLWNPRQDTDQLLNDWYINAVGPEASKYLKQFYDLWESFWTKELPNSDWWNTKGGNGNYLRFNNQSYIDNISYSKIIRADELLMLTHKKANTYIQKMRVEDLIDMWEFCKMNYFYFRQKNISKLKIPESEKRLLNSRKVTKKEIEKKITELERHPLYNDIAKRYRNSNSVRY